MNFPDGETLLFDKPKTWTSFDVVKKVRNIVYTHSGKTKVGHAGTLDPLATGLLILCTGKHTKQITEIQDLEKCYEVTLKLGATTASYDAEYPEENLTDTSHITREDVEKAIEPFMGETWQMPPVFSAVKINGKRAYKSARKGKEVAVRPRQVNVYAFDILKFESPEQITATIRCSKGTYIRSLARDLGKALGVGGYITDLRRTYIGNFRVEDAWTIEAFEAAFKSSEEQT